MGSNPLSNVNYEAKYNEQLDINSALREKMFAIEAKLKETYRELEKLRAQMEVVHLIFGGK